MDEPAIYLNREHYPVTALGPGRRIGVWFQGCTIGCRGCISKDTWDRRDAPARTIPEVLDSLRRLVGAGEVDGLTVSGGEPFEQPEALLALIKGVRLDHTGHDDFDVLVFSGLRPDQLASYPEAMNAADVIVAGPYLEQQAVDEPLRASANQELLQLTELGRRRFANLAEDSPRSRAQVVVTENQVYLIGLPSPGAMDQFSDAMAAKGIDLMDQSWKP